MVRLTLRIPTFHFVWHYFRDELSHPTDSLTVQVDDLTVAVGGKKYVDNGTSWLQSIPWGTKPSTAWQLYDRGPPVPIWELVHTSRDSYLGGWLVQILEDEYVRLLHKVNSEVLHNAVLAGNRSVIRFLVSSGIDVNQVGADGKTALQVAVELGELEAAKQLIQSGASLMIKPSIGPPLLHIAAARGHAEMCELLLRAGANIMEKDDAGETAVQVARRVHTDETLDFLHRYAGQYHYEL
jgi:hypothetical protein